MDTDRRDRTKLNGQRELPQPWLAKPRYDSPKFLCPSRVAWQKGSSRQEVEHSPKDSPNSVITQS